MNPIKPYFPIMLGLCLINAGCAARMPAAEQANQAHSINSAEPAHKLDAQTHAQHFWQIIAAAETARPALMKQFLSPGIVKRNGEQSLLESFAMLSEALGGDVPTDNTAVTLASENAQNNAHELQYKFADGRRIALKLTITDTAQIDRFSVMPLPMEVAAVAPEKLSAAISAHVNAAFEAEQFSGAVLIARGKSVIHAQAIGMADRGLGRANTLDTPINLGSINKMFTAIAIAQLQAAGKLDWQDKVGKHLPNFPNQKIRDEVTIHQLLTHTSGVGSYWNAAHDAAKAQLDTQAEFLATFQDQPLLFEPGNGQEYSNGGPVILGLIIEALSEQSYYDYIKAHIYKPAGMKHADHYRSNDKAAGFAVGYLKSESGAWQDNHASLSLRGSAAGGGYASARDMLAFSRALSEQRLLSSAQLGVLWQPHTQQGPMGYGYLFSIGAADGRRWIGHNGGAPGIAAEFMHYPKDDLVIIVLANQDNAAAPMREWLHALLEASLD
jgi:CubicO group peptidase (beta-lactamase class C family)